MLQFRLVPPLLIPHGVAEHLQKDAFEQVVELLQVVFAPGDQPFHLAEQMGNALLVVERWKWDCKILDASIRYGRLNRT